MTDVSKTAGDAHRPEWPALDATPWKDTCDTLHLWTQIVGKVRLGLMPMINHWWQVPLYVSARGLTTSLMPAGTRGLEIEFDFIDHILFLRTTDGQQRRIPLEPQTVAAFYAATVAALDELGIAVHLVPKPSEVAVAIPFDVDDVHQAYDQSAAHRYWLALVQIHRVFLEFRSRFIGKVSPVHYFWGGPDLCTTRFSGRPAPKHQGGVPNCPDWVQELAYSHEVSSCGFWPGVSGEGCFYAYAYPQPDRFAEWQVEPAAAYYDATLGEFLLPYAAVRNATHPDSTLLSFLQSTYDAAAELGAWDRAALEVDARVPTGRAGTRMESR